MEKRKVILYKSELVDGVWKNSPIGEGIFLAWGIDYVELDNGIGIISVALIERPDGSVQVVSPTWFKFKN